MAGEVNELEIRARMQDELTRPIEVQTAALEGLAGAVDRAAVSAEALAGSLDTAAVATEGDTVATEEAAVATTNLAKTSTLATAAEGRLAKVMEFAGGIAGKALKYGLLGAGAALGAVGALSIKTAFDVQKATSQIRSGLRSTSDASGQTVSSVNRLATAIANFSGQSRAELLSASANLLTFTHISGDQFPKAMTLAADIAARKNKDIASSTLAVGKALNDPVHGMTALSRVGVQFGAHDKARIADLMKSGDRIAAQNLIIARLQAAVGGSAKAMGRTAAGAWGILKNRVQEAVGEVGKGLLPILQKLLPVLTKTLVHTIRDAGPAIDHVIKALGGSLGPILKAITPVLVLLGNTFAQLFDAVRPLIPILGTVFRRIITALEPALKPLITALGDGLLRVVKAIAPQLPQLARSTARLVIALTPLIPGFAKLAALLARLGLGVVIKAVNLLASHGKILRHVVADLVVAWGAWKALGLVEWLAKLVTSEGAVTAATWLWNVALDANPIGAIILGIMALVAGLIYAYTHFKVFRDVVANVWGWIKGHWPLLLAIFTGPIGLAVKFIVDHWQTIKHAFSETFHFIGDLASRVFGDVVQWAKNVAGFVMGAIHQINRLNNDVRSAPGHVLSWLNPFGDTATPRASGGNLSRTLAAHAAVESMTPGRRVITSAVRSWGQTSGDHPAGRALDLSGPFLSAYAANARSLGVFAELHGAGPSRHAHLAVGDTATPRAAPMAVSGGDGMSITIAPGGSLVNIEHADSELDIEGAVARGLYRVQRSKAARAAHGSRNF